MPKRKSAHSQRSRSVRAAHRRRAASRGFGGPNPGVQKTRVGSRAKMRTPSPGPELDKKKKKTFQNPFGVVGRARKGEHK